MNAASFLVHIKKAFKVIIAAVKAVVKAVLSSFVVLLGFARHARACGPARIYIELCIPNDLGRMILHELIPQQCGLVPTWHIAGGQCCHCTMYILRK